MGRKRCLVLFFLLLSITAGSALSHSRLAQPQPQPQPPQSVKLFVFGDSYADTGNLPSSPFVVSWQEPYGITFPGKPSGRFSDGQVLTDYIASYLGIKSPLPYAWREVGENVLPYGVNFAVGGTGVFDTLVQGPNMSSQIDFFQQLVEENVFTKHDLNSSVALVSLAGNDYATFLASSGIQGMPTFTESIINQMGTNLKRIHELGVRKVAVTGIEPLGCLPQSTASSLYQNCSSSVNLISQFHNQLLEQTVGMLNNETGGEQSVFVILDLYNAFMSALQVQENQIPAAGGSLKFENPLKPCCMGDGEGYGFGCGSVDIFTGAKKYTVCDNPKLSFFWDMIHPSNQGWLSVSSAIQSSLNQLIS